MKHHYVQTSLWYKEKIKDPYQVIAAFFSAADLASHRKHIKAVVKAAASNCICSKKNPGDLLYHFKLLESVINAAWLLNKEKKKSPLDISTGDLLNKNLYCGTHTGSTEWDFLPRFLSKKEYINPYLTFKHFFNYRELTGWKKELGKLLNYALVKTSLSEAGIDMDMLSIYIHLTKMIEAAHLIDVREVTHVGGYIKNRMKIS